VFVNCPTATLVVNSGGSDCDGNIIFSQPVARRQLRGGSEPRISGPQPGDGLAEWVVYTVSVRSG
jgi:hypothetical protein